MCQQPLPSVSHTVFMAPWWCIIGEHFTQDEMDEMLQASVDPEKQVILYKDYVTLMAIDDNNS